MQVVGFEDGEGGRRRRVVRARKAGWALPDEAVPPLGIAAAAAAQTGAVPGPGPGAGASGGVLLEEGDPAEEAVATATTMTAMGASVSWRRGKPAWSWRDADGTVRHSNGLRSPPLAAFEPAKASASLSQSQQQQKMAQIPPDGGVGMRLRARWAWFPAEGVTNELMFPRGAEIREAVDINGDWCGGVYAGRGGLFPGGYVGRA